MPPTQFRIPARPKFPLTLLRSASVVQTPASTTAPPSLIPILPPHSESTSTLDGTFNNIPLINGRAMKTRVPFLPENDFSRYHRHEYVARVSPPHINPLVSTLINSSPESPLPSPSSPLSSNTSSQPITTRASQMWSELAPRSGQVEAFSVAGLPWKSGEKGEVRESGMSWWDAEDEGGVGKEEEYWTEERKSYAYFAGAGLIGWWWLGDGIVKVFGIL